MEKHQKINYRYDQHNSALRHKEYQGQSLYKQIAQYLYTTVCE